MSEQHAYKNSPLQVGDFAPDFTLDKDGGGNITLSRLRGKNVVIYFYPKDDTPGCTTESKDFRDYISDFEYHDTVVLGISKDSIESHNKFKGKYNLSFPLLSDEEGSVCAAYNAWVEKNMYGKKYMGIERSTFLIDKKGVIKAVWPKVKVDGHVKEVIKAVENL